MMALTAGSENKAGQDTVSFPARGGACTEVNFSIGTNFRCYTLCKTFASKRIISMSNSTLG